MTRFFLRLCLLQQKITAVKNPILSAPRTAETALISFDVLQRNNGLQVRSVYVVIAQIRSLTNENGKGRKEKA